MQGLRRKFTAALYCTALQFCLWDTTLGCRLAAPDEKAALQNDEGSGDVERDTGTLMPPITAVVRGASPDSEVPEETEQDFEERAASEPRKDWILAIEKARKALKGSAGEYNSMANPGIRVTNLKEEEQTDRKLRKYQLVLRVDGETCAVTVKQEFDNKYTVEEAMDEEKVQLLLKKSKPDCIMWFQLT
ncbi:uncharacterized protein LOC111267773 [Varroa jacobsoni]|uniref:uncharacterized protein LOC111267773 n=1 Tax=Varroa jacobsoni TaxID=62625 RepID=UPI000BF62D1C|nr:uncharacterized protein LOC111267773 [Varroa jacobsoni]